MSQADRLLREFKKRLAERRQELLEQMAGGLQPDDYQRAIGRVLQLGETFETLNAIKQDLDR